MFRKTFSFGAMLLFVGAMALVTPGTGQAQHHGGGGHGGGVSHGSFNHGGVNHSFSHGSFNHGGVNHGFNHGGVNHSFNHGFNHGGFNRGFNLGGYATWPYYYGSYPYSYDLYSYGSSSPAYDLDYDDSSGELTSSYPDSSSSSPAQTDTSAHVTVSAPAGAEIWFNDFKTDSTGAIREYQTPPLTPGNRYAYEIRARWNENDHAMTQTQHVEVGAGAQVIVNFPVQPAIDSTATSR